MRTDLNVNKIYAQLKKTRPLTKNDLKNYVKVFVGIDIPDKRICPEHSTPMDYLWHCYNSDFDRQRANGDCVVWAGRGAGKTIIGAVATLLDCIFKPNCQVRILAGSERQAAKLYDYLQQFLRNGFKEFLASPIRKNRCEFLSGASVEVLTQSPASVRGSHIHKLRCDEIELFDSNVFEAAKFVTKSNNGLIGAMESISTMHRPYGLMHKLVNEAEINGTPIFKWCLWEVIEKCVDRNCSRCELESYCAGKAKRATGYLKIDDCITQMKRASKAGFESEVLCKQPYLENIVFAEFDCDQHVAEVNYNSSLPLYRAMDFGFVNPFVCLWIQIDGEGKIRIIDEYIKSKTTIEVHAREIKNRYSGEIATSFCDPAGAAKNDVTGTSAVKVLRENGVPVRYRKSSICEGVELVRRALRSGDGKAKLVISPKCGKLIEALSCYHYPENSRKDELPLKDGIYDHPIDALRYFFVNYTISSKIIGRRY
ncbi:MAG: terminase large subunit [Anaerohalosphaeraceae bacterium]|nr:terminase large subunit [Anaerohalosphaeraceae bacterium]